jgi:rfaE bifunctional protein kinase chain/domain
MGKIIVVGEAILDIHTFGKIERINPEAPVPVLHVFPEKERFGLGGAANVANNLANLKEQVTFVSNVDDDSSGNKIKKLCRDNNLDFFFVNDGRPTITKQRFIADAYNQQVLRVDHEEKHDISNEYADSIINFIIAQNPSIVLISDYAKGLITDYLMVRLKKQFEGKIIVDPKPKNIELYKGVTIIKPNIHEAEQILGKEINLDNINESLQELSEKLDSNIIITLGKDGAVLYEQGSDEVYHIDSYAKEVFDVSGCGDTFIATIAYALNNGMNLGVAVDLANKAASIVIGKFGAVPVTYDELFNKNE